MVLSDARLRKKEQLMGLRIEIVLPLVAIANGRHGRATGSSGYANTEVESNGRFVREDGLDNTLAEPFPCSDALSSIPNPGHLSDS